MKTLSLFVLIFATVLFHASTQAALKRDAILAGVSFSTAQTQALELCQELLKQSDRLYYGFWQFPSTTKRLQDSFPRSLGEGSVKYLENTANCQAMKITARYGVEAYSAERSEARKNALMFHLFISPLTAFMGEFQRGPILKVGEHRIAAKVEAECESRPVEETALIRAKMRCYQDEKSISRLRRQGAKSGEFAELLERTQECGAIATAVAKFQPTRFTPAELSACLEGAQ